MWGGAPSCAPLGGFAISARVSLYVSLALYTANAYSGEREMSSSAYARSMPVVNKIRGLKVISV